MTTKEELIKYPYGTTGWMFRKLLEGKTTKDFQGNIEWLDEKGNYHAKFADGREGFTGHRSHKLHKLNQRSK